MRVVLANGCFDVLHPGHVAHLREARAMGDALIVALTEDEFVNKGFGRPIYKWEDRAALLRELRCVNEVIPSRTAVPVILKLRPSIFVKGRDYLGKEFPEDILGACAEVGTELRLTRAETMSTTATLKKLGIE